MASKKLLNTKVRGGGGGGGEGGNKVRHTPEIGGVFSSENPVNQNQTGGLHLEFTLGVFIICCIIMSQPWGSPLAMTTKAAV